MCGGTLRLRQVLLCDRAQAARASVEDMAQGTKRETGQQLRELQVEHGAALRQLASVQEAAARVQQQLRVCSSAAAETRGLLFVHPKLGSLQ